ncbi:MAG TPA: hypothetical protein VF748_14605 [Candidatus Acidoferrum sp.]
MPLKSDAALRKDRTTRATLQHRHFAAIARIIFELPGRDWDRPELANLFADALTGSNCRFDRVRFIKACLED